MRPPSNRPPFAALILWSALMAAPQKNQAAIQNPVAEGAGRHLTFERDVRPILKQHCVHCHGEGETLKAGLDVRLRRFLVSPRGQSQEVAIVPGDPKQSILLEMVKSGEMPKARSPRARNLRRCRRCG